MRQASKESIYYKRIQDYLRQQGLTCDSVNRKRETIHFITKGIGQVIMDVFGIRSAKSQYNVDIEIVAVEVKRSTKRASLRNMIQASNASRIAHYCYLAMPHAYTEKEVATAAEIGIGLLQICHHDVRLITQSRRFTPNPSLIREFLRKNLDIAQCSICQNFSSLYDGLSEGEMREGGAWRKNVFATQSRWVYFCKQCRTKFENALSLNKLSTLQQRIELLEEKQKFLNKKLKAMRARAGAG